MKTILNTELIVAREYQQYQKDPFPNSDFDIGRVNQSSNLRRNFVENLLLYDKIIIATKSFDEIMTLRNWMGGDSIERLLHEGVISFVQTPFAWTYIQKWKHDQGYRSMHGVASIFIADKEAYDMQQRTGIGDLNSNKLGGWSSPDLEKAVEYTLTTFYDFNPKKIGKFARLVAKSSTQINNDEFRRFITNKSEEDLKNINLRRKLNFNDEVDIENVPDNSKDIRRIFRIILANQNIALSKYYLDSDVLAENFYSEILASKIDGEIRNKSLQIEASKLFKVANIPVPEVFSSDRFLTVPQLIKIRNSKEGEDFRKWFHKRINDGIDIQEAYVNLLKRDKKYKWCTRILSFIAPEVVSSIISSKVNIPLVPGIASSLAYEYLASPLINKYINLNPPKTIIDKLKNDILVSG